MQIFVNGKAHEVQAATLQAALLELGYGNATIATALNGEFVAMTARVSTSVTANDKLEIVAPMQGG
jgi:sulfur carrier protein